MHSVRERVIMRSLVDGLRGGGADPGDRSSFFGNDRHGVAKQLTRFLAKHRGN